MRPCTAFWLIAIERRRLSCKTRCSDAAACAGSVHVADVDCCFIKGKLEGQKANARTVAHLKTGKLLAGNNMKDFLCAATSFLSLNAFGG